VFCGIHHSDVDLVWKDIKPLVQKALDKNNGNDYYTTDDVKKFIKNRSFQLWIAVNNDEIEAAFITQIVIYPRCKELSIFLVSGKNIDSWLNEAWTQLKDYGASMKCNYMSGIGRIGWMKVMPERTVNKFMWIIKI